VSTAITLSETALALLQLRLRRGHVEVTPDNLEAHRELVRAGILIALSTFPKGPESSFRFTQEGWDRRDEWLPAPPR
jgi:hypothetical protein